MPEPHQSKRRVLILGLDTFAKKNVAQVQTLEAEGYCFTVITNDQRGDSGRIFGHQNFKQSKLIILGSDLGSKLREVWRVLRSERFSHVELYAAGRMALIYLFLMKLLGHRYVIVERGDIGCLADYGVLIRLSIRLAYRWAEGVIYKETYMEEPLRRATHAPLFFVPNSIGQPAASNNSPEFEHRLIDFLWVNRIVPQRRAAWLLNAAKKKMVANRFVMLGFEERDNLPEILKVEQNKFHGVISENVRQLGFIDPEPYYRQARFFCLPAEVVFGNNSLLEAMSWGVVPIVTHAPGVDLIVEDGVNGIVTRFDEADFHEGLARGAALAPSDWERLSRAAQATVRVKFSLQAWTNKMIEVYRQVASG